MLVPDAGHGGTRLKPTPSPRFTQTDPPAPPQSRRKSTPPVSRLPRSSRSTRPRNARQPPRRRQIPIDRTARTAQPDPPTVSSPEACPTPADRAHRRHPVTAGVRQPLTTTEVQRGPRNVRFWGQSRRQFWAAPCLLVAKLGNSSVVSAAWISPSVVVSLLIEGERSWNGDWPLFLLPTWSAIPALWVRTRRGRFGV